MKDVIVWVLQFAILEVSKKWPKIGTWVKEHAPAALAILSTVMTVLEQVLAPTLAHAGVTVPSPDDVVNVPVLGNYVGTILVDNVLRKIVWHWFLGKVIGMKAAKKV